MPSRPGPAAPPRTLGEIDALRGIAIVAVVGVHVTFGFLRAAPSGSPAMWQALTLHLLTTFATPLFVALSLAGLALGYPRALGLGAEYGTFLARRARRILPAYVVWSVLALVRSEPAALADPGRLTSHLLHGSAAYHLYFVPLIVTYYLLWPLFSRLAVAARRDGRAAGAIVASGLAVSIATWGALPSNGATAPLFWLGYAAVGLVAAPWLGRLHALRSRRALLGIAVGLAAITAVVAVVMVRRVTALLQPMPDPDSLTLAVVIFQIPVLAYALAAMALAALVVALLADARGMHALRDLGRRSYGVYLAHVLVLEVVVQRLLGRPASADFGSAAWVVTLVAQWALCVALTWALIAGLARVPGLAILAGERPPARAGDAAADHALTAPPPSP